MDLFKRFFLQKKTAALPGLVGLEISPQGIAIAYLVVAEGGPPRVKCCDFIAETDSAQFNKVLTQFVQTHQLSGVNCSLVLHPSFYQLQLIEAPEVEPSELRDAVRWKVKELTTIPFEEAIMDVFLLPPDAYRGRMKMANVAIAKKTDVQQMAAAVSNTGLELTTIDITDLALRNIAMLCPEDKSGMAIMRLRSTNSLISVTQEGNLYFTRAIDFGLDTLSSDGVEPDPAQMENLVLEVQRSLDYYESQLGKGGVGRLFVAPTKIKIPGLMEHLNKNLSVQVLPLDINLLVESEKYIDDSLQAQCLAAIGAALRQAPMTMTVS